jgi:hypothetical protein
MRTFYKVIYFFSGVGLVNAAAYPYLKDYQERNTKEMKEIMDEHR